MVKDLAKETDRQFAANVRLDVSDDSELRESLATFGWHPELPAIQDEHGVTLVGNRRMRIAEELGIKPVIRPLSFGAGSEADAERVKLALVSNLGSAPLTPRDRKRIAEHLFGERGWTMQRIGEALGVSQRQISSDLEGLEVTSKPPRPKGGRPKGSGKSTVSGDTEKRVGVSAKPKGGAKSKGGPKPKDSPVRDRAREVVRAAMMETGGLVDLTKLAKESGVSHSTLKNAVIAERARVEALQEPPVDVNTLSISAKEKLDIAIRQEKKKLQVEFEDAVRAEVKRRLDDSIMPGYQKRLDEYNRVIKARKGIMKRAMFKKILACLHPDRVQDVALKGRYEEAFVEFSKLEIVLCDEKEMPTNAFNVPKSAAEWEELKRRATEARRAKRTASEEHAPARR